MKTTTILVALLTVQISIAGPVEDAKKAKAAADMAEIAKALQTYKVLAGDYPTAKQGLQALVELPKVPPVPRRWMQLLAKVPKDPWDRDYRYRLEEGDFSLWSTGSDQKDDEDDIRYERPKQTEQVGVANRLTACHSSCSPLRSEAR